MALRLPTDDDLRDMAALNYLELTDEELEEFQSLMPGMFELYDDLDQMPMPHETIKYRDRDPGQRPAPQDDPLNAILRRCTLKGAGAGKLAGKRFGLKNNIAVAGMPLTCSSLLMDGYVPESDATVVTRLLDAGAEIVATLNMDNMAFSGGADTSAYGPTRNPHNPEHSAGGSSGGSGSALYYDDIDITIGGDQGGSIRVPSSYCGVVGLKPTHSLVPYTGIVGIDQTFDHAGPMARSVEDAALTLEVIAGKDPLDPRQYDVPVQPYADFLGKGVAGMRIGVVTEGFGREESESDVDELVRRATRTLGELGAEVAEVSIPAHAQCGGIVWGLVMEGTAAAIRSNGMGHHWQGLYSHTLAQSLGMARQAAADLFPPTLKLAVLIGTYMSERHHGRMYAKAQNLRRGLRASYDDVLKDFDVLAMPTTPMKAHKLDLGASIRDMIDTGWGMFGNTAPFDMTGHPSLNVPCAKSDGLPVGLMLTGKLFDDGTLFRVGHAFEQHVDWETIS